MKEITMMATEAGWYPDSNDQNTTRYWDGSRWTSEKVWDGSSWVDRAYEPVQPVRPVTPQSPATPAKPASASELLAPAAAWLSKVSDPAAGTVQVGQLAVPRSPAWWTACVGAAGVVLAQILPWVVVDAGFGITASSKPSTLGQLLYFTVAALAVWLAFPSARTKFAFGKAIGLTVVAGLASLFALSNWHDLFNLQHGVPAGTVSPGIGLLLFSVAVLALWVSVGLTWIKRISASQPAS
jgi:Protein of unknown function (DUF2510)